MKSPFLQDRRIWTGLVLLAIGLLLMDRAFAFWRNDARNFAHWDGSHLTAAQVAAIGGQVSPLETRLEDHRILGAAGLSGLCLVMVSGLLLWPISGGRHGTVEEQRDEESTSCL